MGVSGDDLYPGRIKSIALRRLEPLETRLILVIATIEGEEIGPV